MFLPIRLPRFVSCTLRWALALIALAALAASVAAAVPGSEAVRGPYVDRPSAPGSYLSYFADYELKAGEPGNDPPTAVLARGCAACHRD